MMAQLQNIIDDFNEAIADVADVWQEQRGNFTDSKIEQFGTNILRPVSIAGARINFVMLLIIRSIASGEDLPAIITTPFLK